MFDLNFFFIVFTIEKRVKATRSEDKNYKNKKLFHVANIYKTVYNSIESLMTIFSFIQLENDFKPGLKGL